jgi:hypothetical protein
MAAKNDKDNFERIFGIKKTNGGWKPPSLPLNEYPNNSNDEWDEGRIDVISQNSNDGLHYDQ